ncbi:MAG: hypothetical protein ACI4ES_08825 [Roseburia sp.]
MNYNDEHKYDDIINMPHHVSKKHPQMPLLDRAAQFSPFAALTGHGDAITETARLTEKRLDLDENSIEMLDIKLQLLKEKLAEKPIVTLSYFVPDEKKEGGSYLTATGTVKKIDEYEYRIIMDDGFSILINELVAIEGNIFNTVTVAL